MTFTQILLKVYYPNDIRGSRPMPGDLPRQRAVVAMATREALDRWRSVLLDVEQYDALPSGQKVRAMLSKPEARANPHMVNATLVYRVPQRSQLDTSQANEFL
jgi:hypothetical protein